MALEQVEEVEIEAGGVFKYILIELKERDKKDKKNSRKKLIVRGFEWAEFHGERVCGIPQELCKSFQHSFIFPCQ